MSLEKDIESLVQSVNMDLYDISLVNENGDLIYRVSVVSRDTQNGKRKGVDLDECVNLTHLISPLLDVTPPVSGDYRLEVGTPGIERKINTLRQFKLSIGEKVSLKLKSKDIIKGALLKVEDSKITLEQDEKEFSVDFSEILKARTYFEW